MARALWLLYGALAVAELAAEATGAAAPAFLLKLGLVPLLATAWALSGGGDRRVLGFFVGSWVGDVTLSLAPLDPTDTQVLGLPKHDGWFLAGVLAFAAAHLSLIAALRDVDHPDRPGPWTSHRGWFAPLVTWAAVLGQLVLPPLAADPARAAAVAPLAVYAALLHVMVGFALQRHGRVHHASFVITLLGACMFLVSDSLIGLTHLAHLLPQRAGAVAIMATYLGAEALLAWGMLIGERRAAI